MKFVLVDHLVTVQPGKSIVAAKNLSLAEEYLADHFPGFPVLPGVLMLEAAVQTAAWLVRISQNFAHSLVVLKEARGVRYGTFVSPGQTLLLHVDAVDIQPTRSDLKIKGTVNGQNAIQARIELTHLNLADHDPAMQHTDQSLIAAMKRQWDELTQRSERSLAAPSTVTHTK